MENEKRAEQELEDLMESVKSDTKMLVDEFIEENEGCSRDKVRDDIDFDGKITEMVDSSVPIYNYDIMKLGTLADIYHHENELTPAFDGIMTPINVVATAIYEVLEEYVWERLDSYLDELEEDGKFGESDD